MRLVALALFLALVLAASPAAYGQPFKFGVKIGAPFTEVFDAPPNIGINTHTTSFTFGPTAELRLPFGLGAEVDLLYKHSRVASETAHSIEIPVLGKYRAAGGGVLHPYVAAGASFRQNSLGFFVTDLDKSTRGFVAAAGLEIGLPVIALQPEIRFTRWNEAGNSSVAYKRTQVEFLFGIVF